MDLTKYTKETFAVIGKEGSTREGGGFIQRLWADANAHFGEIAPLAKKDDNGNVLGIWGAMTDFSRSFQPWEENYSKGLYLAGVECAAEAEAPSGWTKWIVPGFEYLCAENKGEGTFFEAIGCLQERGIPLAGAVQEFNSPATGKEYLLFPVKPLA